MRILATSREALGVSGETICRVPSLSIPGALAPVNVDALVDVEATQLFVERASGVDPTFRPTPDNAEAIARIRRRLDGIPLAIELAAARVVVLSPAQIEARLQDRFRLLTGGARTAVARQRTLEAAAHVCAGDGISEQDVLDLLSQLIGKSLVVAGGGTVGERRRFSGPHTRQDAIPTSSTLRRADSFPLVPRWASSARTIMPAASGRRHMWKSVSGSIPRATSPP